MRKQIEFLKAGGKCLFGVVLIVLGVCFGVMLVAMNVGDTFFSILTIKVLGFSIIIGYTLIGIVIVREAVNK